LNSDDFFFGLSERNKYKHATKINKIDLLPLGIIDSLITSNSTIDKRRAFFRFFLNGISNLAVLKLVVKKAVNPPIENSQNRFVEK
jgi:hypothetical protein